jgi:hypothetical protein
LRVDSIDDESFVHRRLEHPLVNGSDPSRMIASVSTNDQRWNQTNITMAANTAATKRGWNFPHRIGSSISNGSSVMGIEESEEDDDYYNSAIIRKFDQSEVVQRPVGIRRDISNDRLLYNHASYENPFSPIDPDNLSMIGKICFREYQNPVIGLYLRI